MLKSANAPGRPYVLYATDEIVPDFFIFNHSPTHVLGLRTEDTKLGVYAKWLPLTSRIIPASVQLEFYDYSTTEGQLELLNLCGPNAPCDSRALAGYDNLINNIIPNELQQRLPPPLTLPQELSKIAHILYRDSIAHEALINWLKGALTTVLGYGAEF
jgi:hypothetical protein